MQFDHEYYDPLDLTKYKIKAFDEGGYREYYIDSPKYIEFLNEGGVPNNTTANRFIDIVDGLPVSNSFMVTILQNEELNRVLEQRNKLLDTYSWTTASNSPLEYENKNLWINYLDDLLNLDVSDPYNIIWPEIPTFVYLSDLGSENAKFKDNARKRIAKEVGDIHDLLADESKRVDLIERGLCYLIKKVNEPAWVDTDRDARYLAYANTVISAVDSAEPGYITRADLEDEEELINKLFQRAVMKALAVKEEYFDKINI